MDEIVKAALKKWPNVPHCHGWLALDARGDWYMRDDRIQAAGPFPRVKGSRIEHDKLKAFIGRNYMADDRGAWFFQNGPQRVYVTLEATPWVWRLHWPAGNLKPGDAAQPTPQVSGHTGQPEHLAQVQRVLLDAEGRLYLHTDLGLGIVHSQDMIDAERAISSGHWQPEPLDAAAAPALYGFLRDPAAGA